MQACDTKLLTTRKVLKIIQFSFAAKLNWGGHGYLYYKCWTNPVIMKYL